MSKYASYSIPTATHGIHQHSLLDRLTHRLAKKKLNNKQGTEMEHPTERAGCSKHTREEGKGKELISM
jgi:hypothetical protein